MFSSHQRPRAGWPHQPPGKLRRPLTIGAVTLLVGGFLLDMAGFRGGGSVMAVTLAAAPHSTTIALSPNDQRLWVVNREVNSVSVIQVRNRGGSPTFTDQAIKLAEIPVGLEPRCVALHPNNTRAFVVNALGDPRTLAAAP